MTRSNLFSSGLAACLLIFAAPACTKKTPGGTGAGSVKKSDLVQRVTVAGTVVPRKRTVIMPTYAGYVKKVFVKIGDSVQAGDPVVSIVQSLTANVGEVFPLRAPFSGTVVQVLHSDGEWVEERGDSSILVRIDDLSQLFINSDVPEGDMVKIKVGQEVIIKASAILGRSYKGVIREISIAAREKKEWSRTGDRVEYPIRIEVTDKDAMIKPGMSTLIDIIANKHENVLTLRHEYIRKEGEKYFVTLESGEKRPIEVGLQNEESFEVVKGVSEGDQVKQTDFLSLPAAQSM
jgi:multidrug efflux pump subunit AcrA (membrane-fusion protein)